MKLFVCAVFALAGQALDVWSTRAAIDRGAREMNPLMRPLVERGRYGTILSLKWGITFLFASLDAYRAPEGERAKEAARTLRLFGFVGALAGAWNLYQVRRIKDRAASQ